ncbi:MAG: hypothetical protein U0270_32075 [Labilithrix sp.]
MNVFATSPAHAPAREARKKIEQLAGVLGGRTMPFDRKGVSDRLSRAVRALYAVLDTSLEAPAHSDGLNECARILGEVRALLTPYFPPLLDETIAIVERAGDEVVDVLLSRRNDRGMQSTRHVDVALRPFQASIALPRLHALLRSPIAPPLDIAAPAAAEPPKAKKPPPPKAKSLEELRAMSAAAPEPDEPAAPAEAPAGDVALPAAGAALTDDGEILRRVARDCLEDIAALRNLRLPIPTETWLDQAPFEQRLLDNVDAFVALGVDALPSASLFHAEAAAPDPSRAFAVALTLCCIEGTDTVDVAIATMKQAPPEESRGWIEGFLLAPSPAIDTELPALLDAPNPLLVTAALGVLGARGTLPPDAPERILPRQDPALVHALAVALGRALPKTKALTILANIADGDPALAPVAWTSLARRGDGDVRQRLRNAIRARQAHVAEATELLAIVGRGDDVGLLLEGLALAPTARVVRAVARHGHADAVPALIALLDSKDEELVPVVAAALDFMTNAGLVETKQAKWSPETEATRAVKTAIADRMAWERWYAAARARLDPRTKMRHGLPFTPGMIVAELEAAGPAALRDEAALELVVATNAGLRFRTDDWVAKQRAQLSELRGLVASLGSIQGAWWYAGAGATGK